MRYNQSKNLHILHCMCKPVKTEPLWDHLFLFMCSVWFVQVQLRGISDIGSLFFSSVCTGFRVMQCSVLTDFAVYIIAHYMIVHVYFVRKY